MAANKVQEPDIIIKTDRAVHAKPCGWLNSGCSLTPNNSKTKEILSHISEIQNLLISPQLDNIKFLLKR
jgi:hypothetical protein